MSANRVKVVVRNYRNALPLPLQFCDSWIVVKENPNKKKRKLPPQKFNFSGQQVIFNISCHLHHFTSSDTGRPIIIEKSPLHSVFSSVTETDFVFICDGTRGKDIVFVFMLFLANTINNEQMTWPMWSSASPFPTNFD